MEDFEKTQSLIKAIDYLLSRKEAIKSVGQEINDLKGELDDCHNDYALTEKKITEIIPGFEELSIGSYYYQIGDRFIKLQKFEMLGSERTQIIFINVEKLA
jgi:hypothetical protein